MAEGENKFAGLNQTGLIVFIILLVCCVFLCWIPWCVDSMKAAPEGEGGGDSGADEGTE